MRCARCGAIVGLAGSEAPTACSECGEPFVVGGAPAATDAEPPARALPGWLEDAHALLGEVGEYLCYEDGEEIVIVPITREWTRIGRSLAADVRFDDPTVSRRHALIVRGADGVRVLDDRSLNGVFVNGQRVEWSALTHGDEILVGRHRLHFARLEAVAAAADPVAAQSEG